MCMYVVCVCVRIGELQNPFPVCGGAQTHRDLACLSHSPLRSSLVAGCLAKLLMTRVKITQSDSLRAAGKLIEAPQTIYISGKLVPGQLLSVFFVQIPVISA